MDWRLKGVVGRGSASWDEWVVGRASAAEVGCWSWFVVGLWVTAWVSSGCGLWIGVVVGCGLWIGVVGSWSWIGELG